MSKKNSILELLEEHEHLTDDFLDITKPIFPPFNDDNSSDKNIESDNKDDLFDKMF